jgi:hypothetical protein
MARERSTKPGGFYENRFVGWPVIAGLNFKIFKI